MDTKTKILNAAKEIFAKKGYEASSVRDICDEADVAMSAIHYHFKNKEGLLLKIFEDFSQKQTDHTYKALEKVESLDSLRVRLEIFIEASLSSLMKDETTYRLVLKEIEAENIVADKVLKEKIMPLIQQLVDFFESAKINNLLKKEINSLDLSGLIINGISNQIRSNRINKKFLGNSIDDPVYRKTWTKNILDIVLFGVVEKE